MIALPMWVCRRCGFRAPLSKHYYWRCPRCGAPLDLEYEYEWKPKGRGVSRYSSMLPLAPRVSLGEGGTPTLKRRFMGVNVHLKLEYLNPTGSFKDRGTSLAVSLALRLGYTSVVEDTSGNTGISVAAYASVAGLRARIYVPRDAPRFKKELMRLLGAEVVEAPSRADAAETVVREASNSFYVAHTWNPLYIEGAKTISFEAYEDGFREGAVVAPVGSGGLILGLWRGFTQLQSLGLAGHVRLIAVQGTSVQPVYEKLYGHRRETGRPSRLADGIRVPSPPRLEEIVKAVKESKGCVVVVDDQAIAEALQELHRWGLIVEPTSAAALAGLKEALNQGCIDRGEEVLLPLTGSGLKTVDVAVEALSKLAGQDRVGRS